jgi:hypothetical protein
MSASFCGGRVMILIYLFIATHEFYIYIYIAL